MKVESREGRKNVSVVPRGLNKEERIAPALKRWAIVDLQARELVQIIAWHRSARRVREFLGHFRVGKAG
jgi:hypothetical protein